VTGARDLDETACAAPCAFLDKAGASGPGNRGFRLFRGLGLQLDGENYLIPVDAAITRDQTLAYAPRACRTI